MEHAEIQKVWSCGPVLMFIIFMFLAVVTFIIKQSGSP